MTKRNYGIDFLRMLSMFMVVTRHVLGLGGILEISQAGSTNYWVAWLFEIATGCAVNVFALISGYVMWHSKTTVSRISELWMQVFFYGALMTGIFFAIMPESIGPSSLVNTIFPFTRSNYWYMTAYFGMYLLIPVLNAGIQNITKKAFGASLFACFIFFSIIPVFLLENPYGFSGGYSMLWLCLMYLVGAYISKYRIAEKAKKSTG